MQQPGWEQEFPSNYKKEDPGIYEKVPELSSPQRLFISSNSLINCQDTVYKCTVFSNLNYSLKLHLFDFKKSHLADDDSSFLLKPFGSALGVSALR